MFGRALEQQREDRDRHMSVDAVRGPVVHRSQLQPALHVAPGLLDALQLLVAQRHVLGAEGVVVAVDYELAIESLG